MHVRLCVCVRVDNRHFLFVDGLTQMRSNQEWIIRPGYGTATNPYANLPSGHLSYRSKIAAKMDISKTVDRTPQTTNMVNDDSISLAPG